MSETKIDMIGEAIKQAKKKKVKIPEYLSGGNEEYRGVIKSVRLTGIFAMIPAIIYLVAVAVTFIMIMPTTTTSSKNINTEYFAAGPILIAFLFLYIMQIVFCNRMRKLSKEPGKIKAYLIFTLVNNALPICATILSGQIALPGVLPMLAIIFSIFALFEFGKYKDWYDKFGKTIKPGKSNKQNASAKRSLKEKSAKQEISDTEAEDFDDGL